MKVFKTIFALGLIACLVSCGQSFSDKEKEMLKEGINEAIEDANTKKPDVVETVTKYNLPFCNLLSTDEIKTVFAEAENFEIKEGKERKPDCQITFISGKLMEGTDIINPGGILISGFIPRKRETTRTFLERFMEVEKGYEKIEGLGDEAYLFPSENSSSIIMIQNNRSYRLQLNRVSENESNSEMAIKLMRIVSGNIK